MMFVVAVVLVFELVFGRWIDFLFYLADLSFFEFFLRLLFDCCILLGNRVVSCNNVVA